MLCAVAYFFQRVVLQIPTVNVLQFLGLFIILGIGIDDGENKKDSKSKAIAFPIETFTQRAPEQENAFFYHFPLQMLTREVMADHVHVISALIFVVTGR